MSLPKNLFDCENHTICVPPLLRQRILACNECGTHTMLKDVIHVIKQGDEHYLCTDKSCE